MKKVLLYLFVFLLGAAFISAGFYVLAQKNGGNLPNWNLSKKAVQTKDTDKQTENIEPTFNNQGPAPEFSGITKWFNSDPLKMSDQRGKVVLVHFWTYSSFNSINALGYLEKWQQQYKDQGLQIIGIHTPEFTFEKVASNVEAAIKRYTVSYPVAQDNNYKTWSAFGNQFWPALYLVNQNGEIMYTHFGEGSYAQTEKAIRILLGLEGEVPLSSAPQPSTIFDKELYLGLARLKNFGGSEIPNNQEQIFVFPKKLAKDKFALEGKWVFSQEAAVHTSGFGRIRLNFTASKVFMVAQSAEPTTLKIYVDGQLQKGVTVSNSDLYPLYETDVPANHTMDIELPDNNTQVFTFTFK